MTDEPDEQMGAIQIGQGDGGRANGLRGVRSERPLVAAAGSAIAARTAFAARTAAIALAATTLAAGVADTAIAKTFPDLALRLPGHIRGG